MIRHLIVFLLSCAAALSSEREIEIWPENETPGAVTREAESEIKRNDGFRRITNVSHPTLTLFRAKSESEQRAPAVIICPGGGYRYTVMDKEGSIVAEWLNQQGITGLVLKYRTPNNREGALHDVQRALSLTRARAAEWGIDPKRLGVMGFSAGGNLAAKASTGFTERSYAEIDAVDRQSCRPNFAVLVYPAYLDNGKGGVASDLNLEVDIPPTFIVHTEDDRRLVKGSKIYSAALGKLGLPHEFKLYSAGGHGYGLYPEGDARVWPKEMLDWLQGLGDE